MDSTEPPTVHTSLLCRTHPSKYRNTAPTDNFSSSVPSPSSSNEYYEPIPQTCKNNTPSYTPTPADKVRLSPQFLTTFLPISFYLLYALLTTIQELPMTSIAYLLNKEAKFSPAELTTYYNITFIAWIIKPAYGLISDNIPICGYRRKPYLIFFSFISAVTLVLMVLYGVKHKPLQYSLGFVQAFCISFCEVQVDGLVVGLTNSLARQQADLNENYPFFTNNTSNELTKDTKKAIEYKKSIDYEQILSEHPELYQTLPYQHFKLLITQNLKASIQSEAMTLRTSASLFASLLSVLLHLFLSPDWVVLLSAVVPILIVFCVGIVPEHNIGNNIIVKNNRVCQDGANYQNPDDQNMVYQQIKPTCYQHIASRFSALFHAICILYKPLLFMLLIRSAPNATDPLTSFMYNELNLPPVLLSIQAFVSVAAGLFATILYWKFLTKCSLILSFLFGTIIAAVASLPTVCLSVQCNTEIFHIPNIAYVMITAMLTATTSRFAMMPSLTLAIESYPSHVKELKLEATMFTMFTAVGNVGALVSYSLSMSMITYFGITNDNYTNLHKMIIACAIASLLPLFALPMIKCAQDEIAKENADAAAKEENKTLLQKAESSEKRHIYLDLDQKCEIQSQ